MAYDNTNKWALWTKTAKSGLVYKSGKINVEWKEYNISMFDNDKQWNESRPDFNIILEPVENQGQTPAPAQNESSNVSVEDLPF